MIVYMTTNLINGKKYIGRDSWNKYNYLGSGKALVKAIKKYGKENFKKEILEECRSIEHLCERELYWQQYYDVVNNPQFYNMIISSSGAEKGKKLSDDTKKLISDKGKGKKKTSGPKVKVIQYKYEIIKIPIAEFNSIREAAKFTGIMPGDITSVCRKRQITAGGFIWEYKNDPTGSV